MSFQEDFQKFVQSDLFSSYEKYMSKIVSVKESREEVEFNSGNKHFVLLTELNSDDTVISQIRAQAKSDNLEFRLWLPSSIGTLDLRSNRLNVKVKKHNSEYYITSIYLG